MNAIHQQIFDFLESESKRIMAEKPTISNVAKRVELSYIESTIQIMIADPDGKSAEEINQDILEFIKEEYAVILLEPVRDATTARNKEVERILVEVQKIVQSQEGGQ